MTTFLLEKDGKMSVLEGDPRLPTIQVPEITQGKIIFETYRIYKVNYEISCGETCMTYESLYVYAKDEGYVNRALQVLQDCVRPFIEEIGRAHV